MQFRNTNRNAGLRNTGLILASAVATLGIAGCSSDTGSMHSFGQASSARSSIPITCNGMELSETTEPRVAQQTEQAQQQSPVVSSPASLAYGFTEDDASLRTRVPRDINQFGEFDGQPNTDSSNSAQANFQQHTFLDEGFDGDVSVDPSGKWLVFTSTRHSTHPQIYLQRVDGAAVTQLTSDNADYAFPTFSPDGTQIAFSSTRAGNWDIYVMDIDGRNIVQVTNTPAHDLHPSFSPEGRRLVFSSMGPRSKQWELWTADSQTGERRMIGTGLFPTWSPNKDKDQIAFQRARQRGSRWFSLWTLDLVAGEARSVTEVAVSANSAIVSPTWSPDGGKLAFSTIVNPAYTDPKGRPTGQQDVWTINVDGTNRQRLTDGTGVNATPFWSRDGRVFFVSDRNGVECVWSAQAPAVDAPVVDTRDHDR